MLQLCCTGFVDTDNGTCVVDNNNVQTVISALDQPSFYVTYWKLAVYMIQDLISETIAEISKINMKKKRYFSTYFPHTTVHCEKFVSLPKKRDGLHYYCKLERKNVRDSACSQNFGWKPNLSTSCFDTMMHAIKMDELRDVAFCCMQK